MKWLKRTLSVIGCVIAVVVGFVLCWTQKAVPGEARNHEQQQ